MPVVVARPAITRRWKADDGGDPMVSVRSKAPVDDLLTMVDVLVRRKDPDPQLVPEFLSIVSWPTPQGVAFVLTDCFRLDDLLAVVDLVADRLEAANIDARLGPLSSEYPPVIHQRWNDGYSASVCLIGTPYWPDADADIDWRIIRRMWDSDVQALDSLIDIAVEWCDVEDGRLWLGSGLSSVVVPREVAAASMKRIVRAGEDCSLHAADGDRMQRIFDIGVNGYASFDIGGSERPRWDECAAELTDLLVSVHHLMNWGFVAKLPVGRLGITTRSSLCMHECLWETYEDSVNHFSKFMQDPRRHPTWVLDVYGIQILGPGHDATHVSGDWDIRPLSEGRTLVTSQDLADWFAEEPSITTLQSARDDFGDLVDPIWAPTGELDYDTPRDRPSEAGKPRREP
jgi:hypothetical protein